VLASPRVTVGWFWVAAAIFPEIQSSEVDNILPSVTVAGVPSESGGEASRYTKFHIKPSFSNRGIWTMKAIEILNKVSDGAKCIAPCCAILKIFMVVVVTDSR